MTVPLAAEIEGLPAPTRDAAVARAIHSGRAGEIEELVLAGVLPVEAIPTEARAPFVGSLAAALAAASTARALARLADLEAAGVSIVGVLDGHDDHEALLAALPGAVYHDGYLLAPVPQAELDAAVAAGRGGAEDA